MCLQVWDAYEFAKSVNADFEAMAECIEIT